MAIYKLVTQLLTQC